MTSIILELRGLLVSTASIFVVSPLEGKEGKIYVGIPDGGPAAAPPAGAPPPIAATLSAIILSPSPPPFAGILSNGSPPPLIALPPPVGAMVDIVFLTPCSLVPPNRAGTSPIALRSIRSLADSSMLSNARGSRRWENEPIEEEDFL